MPNRDLTVVLPDHRVDLSQRARRADAWASFTLWTFCCSDLPKRRVCGTGLRRIVVMRMRLWCQECGRPSGPEAKGWRLYRFDEPDEDEEPSLAAHCPVCAYVEFGGSAADRAGSE
jgi:hypothetical protein